MLLESDLIPYIVTPPAGNKSIVLSPHPDDETIGCGGTIRLLLKSKKYVKVIFLTSGDKADPSNKLSHTPPFNSHLSKGGYRGVQGGVGGLLNESHITEYALLREKEAIKALSVLGVSDYEFLRFPDRELDAYYEDVLGRLLKIIELYMPDTIYSPSMIELNPDHRTTAALALEIQKIVMRTNTNTLIHDALPPIPPPRGGRVREGVRPIRIIFYEITTPLRPNILVDITPVNNKKKQAIKKYKSQLKLMDYLRHITSLNTVRSLTVNGPQYVEAFWYVNKPLSDEYITKWLSFSEKLSQEG